MPLWQFEFKAIDKDKVEHDREQSAARKEESAAFKAVADGITNSIESSRQQFTITENKMEHLAQLSKEDVDAVTGGSGFVIVDILPIPVDGTGLSLVAVVNGKNTMRQISYDIIQGRPPYVPTPEDLNRVLKGELPAKTQGGQIGDLGPRIAKPFLILHPSQEKGAYYNINITALNGSTNEKLEVRFEPTTKIWNRKWVIVRGNRIIQKEGWFGIPKMSRHKKKT